MTTDGDVRSRRRLLFGGAAASIGALAARLLGPASVAGAVVNPVTLGATNAPGVRALHLGEDASSRRPS